MWFGALPWGPGLKGCKRLRSTSVHVSLLPGWMPHTPPHHEGLHPSTVTQTSFLSCFCRALGHSRVEGTTERWRDSREDK